MTDADKVGQAMSAEKPEQCKLCQGSKVVGIGLPCLCTMSYPSDTSTPEAATDAGDLPGRNSKALLPLLEEIEERDATIAALRSKVHDYEISVPFATIDALRREVEELKRTRTHSDQYWLHEMNNKYADGYKAGRQSAERELAACKEDGERLNKIAWLIGNIFVHGNFKAETKNERDLELLLRENGTFWDSLADFDAAIKAARKV